MADLMNRLTYGNNTIHDAAMDFSGVQLATCSSDGLIKIFNFKMNSFTHVADLKGHFGPVLQVSWAHPKFGNILASCSVDKSVIIWIEENENKWNKIYEYKNHDSSVNCIRFGPEELRLIFACGSSDGAISFLTVKENLTVWDIKKIKNAHNIGVNAVSWSPFMPLSTFLNYCTTSKSFKRIVSAGSDFLIKIWAEFKGRWNEIIRLVNHSDLIKDVAWAPATSLITRIASASHDKTVFIWSSIDEIHWETKELPMFEDAVCKVSWSPTGNILAVSDATNKVTLWKETTNGEWHYFSNFTTNNKSPSTTLGNYVGETYH